MSLRNVGVHLDDYTMSQPRKPSDGEIYYTILILYYTILYYTNTILYYTILYYTILYYTILYEVC